MIQMTLINIEVGKYLAQPLYTINYTVDKVETSENRTAICPPGIPERSQVINAIIRQDYPEDKMEATINNYLFDPTDVDSKAAFDEMQDFRRAAKEFTDSILVKLKGE